MNIRIIIRKEVIYTNGKSPLALRFTHQRKNKLVGLPNINKWQVIQHNKTKDHLVKSEIDILMAKMPNHCICKEFKFFRNLR